MASSSDNISMAVFCDFENVALGVRDANYEKFDIKPVLERLLLKGSIVVKKSYCDWDRYKGFKATMHEANFELIEIPHVRQSGKNSADIRMVVDALDLCYTKSHVNTFVIVSGDSDFSPLVSKLRENAKRVIGVGVKQSTSDLLVANCDEFIFYDDLVREQRRAAAKRDERKAQPQSRRPSDEGNRKREEMEARKLQALEMVVETFDALVSERGDTGKIWASLLKDTLKRRRPDFSETYYGFRTFGNLLEEAQTRGLFEFGRDEKSGTYVFRGANTQVELPVVEALTEPDVEPQQAAAEPVGDVVDELGAETQGEQPSEAPAPTRDAARDSRRRGGRNRKGRDAQASAPAQEALQEAVPASEDAALATWPAPTPDLAEVPEPVAAVAEEAGAPAPAVETPLPSKERRRAPRKTPARKAAAAAAEAPQVADTGTAVTPDTAAAPADTLAVEGEDEGQADKAARKKSSRPSHKAPSRKPATRAPRRPAKPKTPPENG
ncbi:MAG: NYN domain-containing protein [Massilia sp.]|nr:NYN domain-containing protein [Massilia sp.]